MLNLNNWGKVHSPKAFHRNNWEGKVLSQNCAINVIEKYLKAKVVEHLCKVSSLQIYVHNFTTLCMHKKILEVISIALSAFVSLLPTNRIFYIVKCHLNEYM